MMRALRVSIISSDLVVYIRRNTTPLGRLGLTLVRLLVPCSAVQVGGESLGMYIRFLELFGVLLRCSSFL